VCQDQCVKKEASALPGVGIPASPVVKLDVNFWIFIRRCNLVVADNAFAEISVSLFNRVVVAELFWSSKTAASCLCTGVYKRQGTADPNIHDAICDVNIISNFNSPSMAVFIIFELASPKKSQLTHLTSYGIYFLVVH
jgi:hypothetical protein